ncbi:MAG: hypothetical protein DSZ05_07225 [Sulfurospirillum sp.]|nr:MAG: hypothetical protein DSZ05_07225 [Sulfurospirillum sp.]
MSIDNRFTEEEQFLLTNTPYIVGSAMVFSGGSGLATVKEMYSNAKSYLSGTKKFPDNAIITAILPNMEDWKEIREKTKEFQEKSKQMFKAKGIDSPEKMQEWALEEVAKVAKLLDEKATPQEKKEYYEWLLSIAENVAKAAKEGGFLGFGGERVSGEEKEFYAKIAKQIGMDAKLA